MKVVFYANCQADGVVHFLKKSSICRDWDFHVYHNYQIILGEQSAEALRWHMATCDAFIYQPTDEQPCPGGTIPPTDYMLKMHLLKRADHVSFPYVFNNGFFPIVKHSGGWEIADDLTAPNPFGKYNSGNVNHGLALRFLTCLREQSRREASCDIRLAPFILARFPEERLFLTENHPTSAIYLEIARQLMHKLRIPITWALERAEYPENDVNSPGGAYPIHPAAVRELGLKYPATEGAHDFYANLLHQYIQDQAKP